MFRLIRSIPAPLPAAPLPAAPLPAAPLPALPLPAAPLPAALPSAALTFAALLFVVAAALSPAAVAAEFITLEDECNGRQLLIQGPIERGDYQRFVTRLAQHVAGDSLPDVQDPDVLWTVKLDSPGGDVDEALQMGRLLRRALATTETSYRYARRPDGVYDFQRSGELVCLDGAGRLAGCHQDIVEAECTGACLLIWLGGATRHANEGRLGLHGLAGADPAALRVYLTEMGVAGPWVGRLQAASPPGDGWLTWPQRHELAGSSAALDALTADCPAPLTRDESYRSITAADEAERDRLMDRADAHRRCRRSQLARARAELMDWLARVASRPEPSVVAASPAPRR